MNPPNNPGENPPLLECKNLSKRYPGGAIALNNVNLSLGAGRIAGLLGPNGSGKTTLIKLVNGLLQPSGGTIAVAGNPVGPVSKGLASYLPDRFCLDLWMRIREAIAFYQDFYPDFRPETAETLLRNLGLDLNKRLKTLSKGNKEKVQLALVMARSARLYLLDEPIGGVDPAAREYIIHTIMHNHHPDAGILISTHLIQDVEGILEDIFFLKNGTVILQGKAGELREEKGMSIDEHFREVFKC
jgi:ABC-2 type transport system ATP-binding protein